jgi:hypothetical protein
MNTNVNFNNATTDFKYKSINLRQYDLATKALNKIFRKLESENNGLITSKHYDLEGGFKNQYGDYYHNQIKIDKYGMIWLSKRHVGEVCNDTKIIIVEEFVKTGGDLEELIITLFKVASDIAEAQKITSHNLNNFIMTLEALL